MRTTYAAGTARWHPAKRGCVKPKVVLPLRKFGRPMCGQGTPLQAEIEEEVTTCEVSTEERRCTLPFSVPCLEKEHMKQDIYIQEA